ncbi:MAG: LuxR C-terminal-related transcriptional regulator [Erythrobacter sp.]
MNSQEPISGADAFLDDQADSNGWIVDSKFAPSRPNIDLVFRPRLIKQLDQATRGKIIFLIAPAGFGKSTILGQWNESWDADGKVFAWLSLDDGDAEVNQFMSYCILSLAAAGVDVGQLELAARNGLSGTNPNVILNNLMKAIAREARDCVLVLDDLHHLESDSVSKLIEQFARQAPANFTLVLASRQSPPVDIPILIASGDAIEIGPEQLRLNKEEAISALGDAISLDDAKDIFNQTEGWPVAVQLARVQKEAQPSAPIQAGGSSSLVASYLSDQVLGTVEPELRELLFALSVLDEFNASLVDAILTRTDSWKMLQKLEPLRALFIPTSPDGNWMRLHHLFAEHLFETLKSQSPDRINEIRSLASQWFEGQGRMIQAVKYAKHAGKHEEIERLILDAGGWAVILSHGINVMRAVLRYTPDQVLSSNGRLMLARAYLSIKDGEYSEARTIYDASAALRGGDQSDGYRKDHRLVGSMLQCYEDRDEWAEATIAHDLIAEIDQWEPLEAGTLLCEKVIAELSYGNLDSAQKHLDLAFGQMRQCNSILGLNYCYIHAGILALYEGNFDLAKANIFHALELAESNFGEDSGLKHLAKLLEYSLRVWTGQFQPEEVDDLANAFSHVCEYDGWTEVYLVGLDALFHFHIQCGDYVAAIEVCEDILAHAARRGLIRLEQFATVLKMRTTYLRGHENEAKTIAELVDTWSLEGRLDDKARSWQIGAIASSSIAMSRLAAPSKSQVAMNRVRVHCEEGSLSFHQLRILVAEAVLQFQTGKRDGAIKIMIDALALAAPKRAIGPFLGDETLLQLLHSTKASLRGQSKPVILASFIADVLTRHKALRPHLDGGLLSAREMEILEQLAGGRSNKQIARRFELTENTIKFHLKNIYNKLSVNSRTQAIAAARQHGIIE